MPKLHATHVQWVKFVIVGHTLGRNVFQFCHCFFLFLFLFLFLVFFFQNGQSKSYPRFSNSHILKRQRLTWTVQLKPVSQRLNLDPWLRWDNSTEKLKSELLLSHMLISYHQCCMKLDRLYNKMWSEFFEEMLKKFMTKCQGYFEAK